MVVVAESLEAKVLSPEIPLISVDGTLVFSPKRSGGGRAGDHTGHKVLEREIGRREVWRE